MSPELEAGGKKVRFVNDPTIGQMAGLFKKPWGVFVWIGIIGGILGSLAGVAAVVVALSVTHGRS